MNDTQWPRFEVFQQSHPHKPHENVGAVHAPDAEMALLNARDVFVRRPRCLSAWVIPAEAILAKTAQELERQPQALVETIDPDLPPRIFYIFQKQTQRQAMTFVTHVGEVEARTPKEALRRAIEKLSGHNVYVWWVAPASAIARSDPEDVESMYEPALHKPYRHPAAYKTFTLIRKAREKGEMRSEK